MALCDLVFQRGIGGRVALQTVDQPGQFLRIVGVEVISQIPAHLAQRRRG